MSPRRRTATAALAVVVCAASWTAADSKGPWKSVLPEGEFSKLVTAEAKVVSDAIGKGLADKKMATKAKVSALMIAAYAQSAMLGNAAKGPQLAALRDKAVAASKAAADGNADEARKLAAELTPTAGGTGKAEPVDLSKHLDLADLMTQFKPERGGGKELEKKLKALSAKRAALTPAEVQDAVSLAYQSAIIAQFTEVMGPDADMGNKKKADWIKMSQEMGTLGVEAAKTASASRPDDKAVKAALKRLDDNCTKCHQVFRD
jgi:cytochrome c556